MKNIKRINETKRKALKCFADFLWSIKCRFQRFFANVHEFLDFSQGNTFRFQNSLEKISMIPLKISVF